jgi:hypothetical protein
MNTMVDCGEQLTIISGRDTTLLGANASPPDAQAAFINQVRQIYGDDILVSARRLADDAGIARLAIKVLEITGRASTRLWTGSRRPSSMEARRWVGSVASSRHARRAERAQCDRRQGRSSNRGS